MYDEITLFFQLTFHNNLLGNMRSILRCFVCLLTNNYGNHLMESEQSQNSMVLLKKLLKSFDIMMKCN